MKFRLLLTALALVAVVSNGHAKPITITDQDITGPGGEERHVPFITTTDGSHIMLPYRATYPSRVYNSEHSIVALNFTETGDYGGCDLAVSSGSNIYVLDDLYSFIQDDLTDAKILPEELDDKMAIEVLSIEGNTLHCRFIGTNSDTNAPIRVKFDVLIQATPKGIDCTVQNKDEPPKRPEPNRI